MRQAWAVIGTNFGDEGKGLITDYLCSIAPQRPLVVRFGGGAQAGHTVVTPEGQRHVFHHFGSGSFLGCRTYLGSQFIVNPWLWAKERTELRTLGIVPKLLMHPDCLVTTPYDMWINQAAERARGDARHGSCGKGINETFVRTEALKDKLAVRVRDFVSLSSLRAKLLYVRRNWFLRRLEETAPSEATKADEIVRSESLIDNFMGMCRGMTEQASIAGAHLAFPEQDIVFEGAQGLALEEDSGFFPHVTRGFCGLRNVLPLAEAMGVRDLHVAYVTRAYATRHGAGPLPHEDPSMALPDSTNDDNEFQGPLRFAPLDLDALSQRVLRDFLWASGGPVPNVSPHMAVTHLDQIGDYARIWRGDKTQLVKNLHVAHMVGGVTGFRAGFEGRGPTRNHVSYEQEALFDRPPQGMHKD